MTFLIGRRIRDDLEAGSAELPLGTLRERRRLHETVAALALSATIHDQKGTG